MRHLNQEVDRYRDVQFNVLAACHKGAAGTPAITQPDYRRITAALDQDGKTALVRWLGGADIDVEVAVDRVALYHTAPGRQYRPTKRELESGRFECPACHIVMVMVTRKAKDALFRCPDCAWSIARSDIFEPEQGEVPDLRDDVAYDQGVAPDPKEEVGPW